MTFVEVQPEHRKQNQQKQQKRKKKQNVPSLMISRSKRPRKYDGGASQFFSHLNLTLSEPNTNYTTNPINPIQSNLIQIISHNSLITPDREK